MWILNQKKEEFVEVNKVFISDAPVLRGVYGYDKFGKEAILGEYLSKEKMKGIILDCVSLMKSDIKVYEMPLDDD